MIFTPLNCPIWSHWSWQGGSLGYGGATTVVIKTLVITTPVKLAITFKMALVITANIS